MDKVLKIKARDIIGNYDYKVDPAYSLPIVECDCFRCELEKKYQEIKRTMLETLKKNERR